MQSLERIMQDERSTLVAQYTPSKHTNSGYQSEAALEAEFIAILESQGYEYVPIKSEEALIENLKKQLEALNNITFSPSEWQRFFKEVLCRASDGIIEKTTLIQEQEIQVLKRDDGREINIKLLDKNHIYNNRLQVINQYAVEGGRKNRYDVSVLVNGLPLVHIELKRRGVHIKEAFNQISRYGRESFWAGNGLFEFVQIFVISNGTYTKYYANTTRESHLKDKNDIKVQKSGHSFEFTSFWADLKNNPISDLCDFAKTFFFAKHTLLRILCRYCVFDVDRKLLVLRPYQIAATEKILQKIAMSYHHKLYGCRAQSGGYIWHTTGSGKTLTSFKVAQLASGFKEIYKVLFVVDRKDLDYQSIKEYDRFQKGAVDSTKNTKVLSQKLHNDESRIIVTTIQKLARFVQQHKDDKSAVFDKHIVIIFDECHRSQFGEMHGLIKKHFKKYYLFGFTGTPIFAQNANGIETTQSVFGEQLHTYSIIHAIRDKNVLPFRVAYISTIKQKEDIEDKKVYAINKDELLLSNERIQKIVSYILEHFDVQTKRDKIYTSKDNSMKGFNSLFATFSIEAAIAYYKEFKRQNECLEKHKQLKIGLIYSFGANEEARADIDGVGIDEENSDETIGLEKSQRDFLESAISDYNAMFKQSFDASAEKFANYYKDISKRLKEREIDLVIVVNMFLTGFDATTLNTLWVDKNLKYHGLLQAYSRTNRILNAVKTFGNIVCFRDLKEATDKSLMLFGDENAQKMVFLRSFEEYYYGYDENGTYHKCYAELVESLRADFALEHILEKLPLQTQQKAFIELFSHILKSKNILSCFDEFMGKEILTQREWQDYQSHYIDIYTAYKKELEERESVLEVELIKQIEANLEYIIELIRISHKDNRLDRAFSLSIEKSIDSSIELRNKKDLILSFLASLSPQSDVDKALEAFIAQKKQEELEAIITAENLKPTETRAFVRKAFELDSMSEYGTSFSEILPPRDYFSPHTQENHTHIFTRLYTFFESFRGFKISA